MPFRYCSFRPFRRRIQFEQATLDHFPCADYPGQLQAAPPPTDAFAAAEQPAPTSPAQSPGPATSFAATAPSTQISRLNPVVASVGQVQVTRDQIIKPLIDAYGLNILLNVIQLEIAKQNAEKEHLVVTADDIQREHDQTINNMFKDANQKLIRQDERLPFANMTAEAQKIQDEIKQDNDQAFDQFLANQHLSRAEFDIVIETNANLRKIAEPLLAGKISEDNLRPGVQCALRRDRAMPPYPVQQSRRNPGSQASTGDGQGIRAGGDGCQPQSNHRPVGR